jgi:hypothetical protein
MLTVPANGSISHVWVSKLPQKENGHVTKSFAVKEVKSPNERFFVSYVCGSATPGMRQKAPKPELHGHVHPYIWELLSIPPMRHAPVGLWPWLFTRGGGGIARSVPDRPNCGVAVVLRAMGHGLMAVWLLDRALGSTAAMRMRNSNHRASPMREPHS